MDCKNFFPYGKRFLVQKEPPPTKKGVLIIEKVSEKRSTGKVIKIGNLYDGPVYFDDVIFFNSYAGIPLDEFDQNDLILLHEDEILGVIPSTREMWEENEA